MVHQPEKEGCLGSMRLAGFGKSTIGVLLEDALGNRESSRTMFAMFFSKFRSTSVSLLMRS